MKKNIIAIIIICFTITGFAQTQSKHYIKSTTYLDSLETEEIVSLNYYDNFGRPEQSIALGTTPLGKDIVQPYQYDELGRMQKAYMAYPTDNSNNADFVEEAIDEQSACYGDEIAFTEVEFDNSPYNRVMKSSVLGDNINDNYMESNFYVETAGDIIRNFQVDENNKLIGNNSFYQANQLTISKTNNKSNNTVWIYTNKSGQTVLKVQALTNTPEDLENPIQNRNGATLLITAYAYDKYGLLRYVIPPEAYEQMETENNFSREKSSDFVKQKCYYYEYNTKHLLIKKRVPGVGVVLYHYDELNRLRTTQDTEQRLDNILTFYNYDNLGRIHSTGIALDDMSIIPDTIIPNQGKGSIEKYLSFSYYENYDFIENMPEYEYVRDLAYHEKTDRLRGYATGSKIRVLTNDEEELWLTSVTYYDRKGRAIQTITDNHKDGKDIVSIQYDYAGMVLQTKYKHTVKDDKNNTHTYFYMKTYHYDHAKRLIKVEMAQNQNNYEPVTLYELKYNELGQIITKNLHKSYNDTTFVQSINYDYNIKGMLDSINSPTQLGNDFFAMSFDYELNGNISQTQWNSTEDTQIKTYEYTYDNINRLKTATYTPNGRYDVNIEYDLNGNITTLTRKGQILTKNIRSATGEPLEQEIFGSIDDLTYEYVGNQLVSVDDAVGDIQTQLNNDFRDNGSYSENDDEYTYDRNENMLTDLNKNITIEYNYINQPVAVIKDANNRTEYMYTAGGTKLQTKITENGNEALKTDYCGAFVYENDVLSYITTEVGRITFEYQTGIGIELPPIPDRNVTTTHYEYNITDHLGNIRAVFNSDSVLLQENAYYPFGMRMSGQSYQNPNTLNSQNPFLYNGKELQTQTNYIDYGFRQLDPQLGRWHCVDKLAEMYYAESPYTYAGNDPINHYDILGLTRNINYNTGLWEGSRGYDTFGFAGDGYSNNSSPVGIGGSGAFEAGSTAKQWDKWKSDNRAMVFGQYWLKNRYGMWAGYDGTSSKPRPTLRQLIDNFKANRANAKLNRKYEGGKRCGFHPFSSWFANGGKGGIPEVSGDGVPPPEPETTTGSDGFINAFPYTVVHYNRNGNQQLTTELLCRLSINNQTVLNDGSTLDGLPVTINPLTGNLEVNDGGTTRTVYSNTGGLTRSDVIFAEADLGRLYNGQGAQVFRGNQGGSNRTLQIIRLFRGW